MFGDNNVPKSNKPKIVALTGHVEPNFKEKAFKSGMDLIYSKPIRVKEIAQLLWSCKYNIQLPIELEEEWMD